MPTPRPERLRVALFGASTKGRDTLRLLRRRPDVHVACFLDNDASTWRSDVEGVPVHAPADAPALALDAVLISSLHVEPIFHQLARLGLAERTAVSLRDFESRFAPNTEAPPGATTSDAWVVRQLRRLTHVSLAVGSAHDSLALCTVISNNYLAYARTLAVSFLRQHPSSRVCLCLVDTKLAEVRYPDADDPRIQVIEARELGLAAFDAMAFQYTTLELNTAIKPAFFRHVFDHFPIDRLLYLDPDIVVFRPLTPILDQLDRHAIALTPHLTMPVDDGLAPGEGDILRAGVFNLGFIGLSRRPETFRFLDWWASRLARHCVVEPERGLFVDQRWIDLVPAFFDDYVVLKEPGYNVAYWNLHERDVALAPVGPLVNGQPLYFFHYSGFDPGDIARVSRYQNRHRLPERGPLRSLFELYAALLAHHGHAETQALPYRYATFDNGVAVADGIRRVFRSMRGTPEGAPYGDPFTTAGRSFFNWLKAPVMPGSRLSNLVAGLHATRDELRLAFPDPRGTDADALVERIASTGSALYGLHPVLLETPGYTMHQPLAPKTTTEAFYAPVNHRQQPHTPQAIAAAVKKARWIVDGYLTHLPATTRLAGARVLEVGPGAWHGPAVLLACRGARVTVVDRYLVPWSDDFHVPFFEALLEDVLNRRSEDEAPAPIRRLLEARAFVPDVVRREAASAETLACPDASFDLVLSSAVFEHLEHVPRALANLARLTAPAGLGLHQIHFGDHRDDDRQLEYLTLDRDLFWSMFELSWGECGNRWRHTDFAAAFTQAGFDVLGVEPVFTAPDAYLRDVRPRLHTDFATRTDAELRTLCAWMTCRRNGTTPAVTYPAAPGLVPTGSGVAHAQRLVAGRRIVVYGAGAGGRFALDLLERLDSTGSVVAVCDSHPATHGRVVRGHAVRRFEDVSSASYDTVIVASLPGHQAIADSLRAAGLVESHELHALGFVGAFTTPLAASEAHLKGRPTEAAA